MQSRLAITPDRIEGTPDEILDWIVAMFLESDPPKEEERRPTAPRAAQPSDGSRGRARNGPNELRRNRTQETPAPRRLHEPYARPGRHRSKSPKPTSVEVREEGPPASAKSRGQAERGRTLRLRVRRRVRT